MEQNELKFRVKNKEISFFVSKSIKKMKEMSLVLVIDVIDKLI